jgi:hypothetical protein
MALKMRRRPATRFPSVKPATGRACAGDEGPLITRIWAEEPVHCTWCAECNKGRLHKDGTLVHPGRWVCFADGPATLTDAAAPLFSLRRI